MWRLSLGLLVVSLVSGVLRAQVTATPAIARLRTVALLNALWLTDTGFAPRTMYMVGGRLRTRRPARVDQGIDLTGRFVIPPYADAHTHAFSDTSALESAIDRHTRDGVLYAMNLLNANRTRRAIAARLRKAASVDVALASAGVTGVRGHPILSEEMAANGWRWDSLDAYWNALLKSHKADGDSYVVMETRDDVKRRWPTVIMEAPDLVKIFLLDTERYAALRADTLALDHNGLDPAVVPALVCSA